MIRLVGICVALFVMAVNFSAYAKNPGVPASDCVVVSRGGSDNSTVKFSNRCNEKIFVIWCGNLKHTSKECGDGPKDVGKGLKSAGFFTHSANIEAGGSTTTQVKGQFRYAACKGGISFGNDGEYTDDASGGFRCLNR